MEAGRLTYRLPCPDDADILRDYMDEHLKSGETSVTASMGYFRMAFSEWIGTIQRNADEGNAEWGRSLLLLAFHGEKLVGLLSVRYELPLPLRETLGDVGYGVRPAAQKQGYAAEMLKHGLRLLRERGRKDAILGCYKDNVASEKTILKCGGHLIREGDFYTPGRVSRYYEIKL